MENVKNSTRASKRGTTIYCPKCNKAGIVYSFNCKRFRCCECKQASLKTEFMIDPDIPEFAKFIRSKLLNHLKANNIGAVIFTKPINSIVEKTRKAIIETDDTTLVNTYSGNYRFSIFKMYQIYTWGNFTKPLYDLYMTKRYETDNINEIRKQKLEKIKINIEKTQSIK